MIEQIQNIEWGFWEVAVAVLFGVGGIILWILERRRNQTENAKVLAYSMISNSLLVNPAKLDPNRLKIVFDENEVENLYVAIFEVTNQGRIPIVSQDFASDLAIFCGNSAKLLSVEVDSTTPDDLKTEVEMHGSKAVLKPLLLNGGDRIRLKLVGSGFDSKLKLQGRVVGVSNFVERDSSSVIATTFVEAARLAVELALRGSLVYK